MEWSEISAEALRAIEPSTWAALYAKGTPTDEAKPYENEHACRIRPPSAFQAGSFRRVDRGEGQNRLSLIMGRLKGESTMTLQAFRYPKASWTVERARAHCRRHDGIAFEAARKDVMGDSLDNIEKLIAGLETPGFVSKEAPQCDLIDDGPESLDCPLNLNKAIDRLLDRGAFEFHCELKEVDPDKREIRGYANTKNTDRMGDRIEPTAFERALSMIEKRRVPLLQQHDHDKPIGLVTKGRINSTGLLVDARVASHPHPLHYVEDAWWQIDNGLKGALSVGFRTVKSEAVDPKKFNGATRRITSVDLLEVSVVTVPANAQSLFSVVRGLVDGTDQYDRDTGDPIPDHPLIVKAFEADVLRGKKIETAEPEEIYGRTLEFMRGFRRDLDERGQTAELLAELRGLRERIRSNEGR